MLIISLQIHTAIPMDPNPNITTVDPSSTFAIFQAAPTPENPSYQWDKTTSMCFRDLIMHKCHPQTIKNWKMITLISHPPFYDLD